MRSGYGLVRSEQHEGRDHHHLVIWLRVPDVNLPHLPLLEAQDFPAGGGRITFSGRRTPQAAKEASRISVAGKSLLCSSRAATDMAVHPKRRAVFLRLDHHSHPVTDQYSSHPILVRHHNHLYVRRLSAATLRNPISLREWSCDLLPREPP